MMPRRVAKIEVGAHAGLIAYTAIYDNGDKEHHLYSTEIALQLAELLSGMAEKIKSMNKMSQSNGMGDSINVGENVNLILTGGDSDGKKIH